MFTANQLDSLKILVCDALRRNLHTENFSKSKKEDNSWVTNIDIQISQIVKQWAKEAIQEEYNFYSEEEHSTLSFPALVLDPIDGTKQLILHYPECALSMAYLTSPSLTDSKNIGYIFNPFTQLEMKSWGEFYPMSKSNSKKERKKLCALISDSEWEKGITSRIESRFMWIKSGSIAHKLALLSAGVGDFIITYRPKSLWDIAAGSIIAAKRGIYPYTLDGSCLLSLDHELFTSPLIWCDPADLERILFQI